MEEGESSIFKQNIDTGQNATFSARPVRQAPWQCEQQDWTRLTTSTGADVGATCEPSLHSELCFALPLTSQSVLLGPSHLMD